MVQQLRETFHDMRQPVANMMALAAAALTEPALPAATRDRLERIIEQAEWLADMIHGCLVAQHQEEPDDIEKPGHDLADIVHVVGEVMAAECLTWPGDVTLAAPAGPVSVEIQQLDDAVMLAVEDDGPGFGEIPSGVGLGLSAVARNVIKYGGRIEYGRGVRGGTRVSLWLP